MSVDGRVGRMLSRAYFLSTQAPVNGTVTTFVTLNATQSVGNAPFFGALRAVLGIIYASLIICTVVGNALVVTAVLKFRRLRHKTNYIILSLAIADLTVAVLVMPFSLIYDMVGEWYFGWVFCYFWRSCDVMCCTASILHICCIALDRFWAIRDPFSYNKKMTMRTLLAMVFGSWTCSAGISFLPFYLGWFTDDPQTLYKDTGNCDLTVNRIYAVCSSMTSFFVPFTLISIAYAYIFRIARIQAELIRKQTACLTFLDSEMTGEHPGKAMKRIDKNRKAVNTLGILMGVFVVSWLPFFLMYLILPFCPSCQPSYLTVSLITWLGYGNSSLNPLIYTYLNSDFRRAFKLLLCWCVYERRDWRMNPFSDAPIPNAVKRENNGVISNRIGKQASSGGNKDKDSLVVNVNTGSAIECPVTGLENNEELCFRGNVTGKRALQAILMQDSENSDSICTV